MPFGSRRCHTCQGADLPNNVFERIGTNIRCGLLDLVADVLGSILGVLLQVNICSSNLGYLSLLDVRSESGRPFKLLAL